MPFINLIQEQRLGIRRDEMQARTYLYAFAVIAGISIFSALGFYIDAEATKGEESRLRFQLDEIKPLTAQIDQVNTLDSQLEPRVQILQKAQVITQQWDHLLTHFATQTPDHIWLSGVRCQATDPAKPITVTISGISNAQEPVGDFILRLNNLADVENVQLRFTQEKNAATYKGIEFQVDADIKDSIEKKPDVKQEGDPK
jgi:Tfp pilus assembly protein PilN